MVPYALPDSLARCGKDRFPKGSRLCAGTLWSQDGPAQQSLCEPSLQGSCVVAPDAGGWMWLVTPSPRDHCRVTGRRLWDPSSWVLVTLQTRSPSPLQPPAPLLGAGRGISLQQEKG